MVATRANQVGGADYTSGSLREDLANFITLVSPKKTPHLSMIGTNKASQPRHEWQTDTLNDPKSNAKSGSFEFDTANNVSDTPNRLSNYTQVYGETIHVEGSLLRSNPAGAKNWFNYAMDKRKVELRRDIERKHVLYNDFTVDGSVVYNSGNTREMAGLAAYAGIWNMPAATSVELNGSSGAGTAITQTNGQAFSVLGTTNAAQGTHVVQYTAAPTTVNLTLPHFNSVFKEINDQGGDLDTILCPTGLKTHISNLLIAGNGGAAQRRADEMAMKLNLSVDIILTDFGQEAAIVHDYIMESFAGDASSSVFIYDSDKIKRTVLQSYDFEEDRSARYGKGGIIFCEETIEVKDPSSLAVISGVKSS